MRYLTITQGIGFVSGSFAPLHTLGHLWYITWILLAYLLTPLVQKWLPAEKSSRIRPWMLFAGSFMLIILTTAANRLLGQHLLHTWFIPLYIWGYLFYRSGEAKPSFHRSLIFHLAALLVCLSARGLFRVLLVNHDVYLTARGAHFGASVCYNCVDFLVGISLYISLRRIFACISLDKFATLWAWSDRCSYGIYLTHMLAILLAFQLASSFPWLIQGGVAVVLSVGFGWLFSGFVGWITRPIYYFSRVKAFPSN